MYRYYSPDLSIGSLFTSPVSTVAHGFESEKRRPLTSNQQRLLCAAIAVIALLSVQNAGAQSATDTENNQVVEEIIVTAERFNRPAQAVAGSLTVFNKMRLEKADMQSLQDLDRHTPNVLLASQGSPRFSINSVRGISSTVRADYFSQTIGVYIDGVPVTAAEFSRGLGDVKQIEVLRGPQGTLYGRNTPGGIINITTQAPSDEFQAEISARSGNNGQRGATALLRSPIVEDLISGKLYINHSAQDGFTDYAASSKSIDDLKSTTGSAALKVKFSEKTKMTLSISIEDIKQGAYAFQAFNEFEKRSVNITPRNREDRAIKAFTINTEHQFDQARLQSITGLRRYDVRSNQDIGYNPVVRSFGGGRSESTEKGDQLSQEVRLSGLTGDQAIRWLIGGFYSEDTVKYDYLFNLPAFGPPSLSSSDYDKQELSVFGEVTATVLDNIDLTTGVRVSKDSHKLVNNTGADQDIDFTIVTPKFRAAYRIDDKLQVYALASRGSRTGGFNRFSSGDHFKPEYLWNYELGIKSQWLDDSLTINAATFYIDWDDQQVVTLIGPGSAKITNSGKAHNFGGEMELSWEISSAFSVSGFFGFNAGEYDTFMNQTGADLSTNKLVNTPETNAGIAAEFHFPLLSSSTNIWLRPEITYSGDHYFDAENRLLQKSYSLFNLTSGIDFDGFSISIFAKNLFDKNYRSYGYTDSLSNFDLAVAGETRTFGLNIKAEF